MTTQAFSDRKIYLLKESNFALDGGAMFGIIPQPLWAKTNPPDPSNRIDMAARAVLIVDDAHKILIDVGIGTDWSPRDEKIYKINASDPCLVNALGSLSITAEEITDVILTHLHFDHAGGLRRQSDSGESSPAFPNARHWVQRRNWSWAHRPSDRDGGSYRLDDFAFLGASTDAPPLHLINGIAEILPGIEVLPVHGHTFGMQLVKISAPDHTYLFLADLVPTTSHLRAPYVMGYDLQPLKTVEEKKEMLYHASRQDWILLFSHDPHQAAGRVEMDSRGRPTFVPLDRLPSSLGGPLPA